MLDQKGMKRQMMANQAAKLGGVTAADVLSASSESGSQRLEARALLPGARPPVASPAVQSRLTSLTVRYFTVMCKDDVEVRGSPTHADTARIGHFLHPGQVLAIDDRRQVGGSHFLHLADGRGWVFERKDQQLVMTEAYEFQRGLWHFCVICEDDVETRLAPTYSDALRSGLVLLSGDCVAVDERCMVANARFLKLADGGWVFEFKNGRQIMREVRSAPGPWRYTVVGDQDVEIRATPTYADEARTGLTVHPGDCVAIDERCRANATWFLRLADGRGWLFETKDSRPVMRPLR